MTDSNAEFEPMHDVPPRPDLPHEKPTTSKWRHVGFTLAAFVVAFLFVNEAASTYLGRYTSNRGYWIVHQKWELLEDLDEPVDWLIIGDSSCNQGVHPGEWEQLTGGKTINLCTIGNMVTVDDAWMLERHIEKYGPPKNVLIMHVYDMWHRDLNNVLLGQIPLGYGFWNRWDPAVELEFSEWRTLIESRYLPLYSQNASLKQAARTGLEKMSWKAPFKRGFVMDEQGFMPWYTAYPRGVRGDAGGHLRFLRKTPFKMSDDTRRGLAAIGRVSDEHGINVHIAPSPVVNILGRSKHFRDYQKSLDGELQSFAEKHERVNHHPEVYTFPATQMENADHVVFGAAIELTRSLAVDIAGVDLRERASAEVLKPEEHAPDTDIGKAPAWSFGPEGLNGATTSADPALLTGLSLQVPVRLQARPRDRAAVVSQWSTRDEARAFEFGVNHLQQPYLAVSSDGRWNKQTMMLVSERQLRFGEDSVISASLVPGKVASIWINGEKVAETRRNVPGGVFFTTTPVRIGNRLAGGTDFVFPGTIGEVRLNGAPISGKEIRDFASSVDVSLKAPQFEQPTQLTKPPGHHWFGYYDKHQFSPDQRYLLVMKTPFENRTPSADDVIEIGMIDLEEGNTWRKLGESRAWSWQQGCMLQWRPGSDTEVLWNDREGDQFVTRVHDISTGKTRTIDHPIYHVAPDGKYAVDADFARIQHMRPGYGYAGVPDENADELTPDNRPINLIDLETGNATPIVRYADFVGVKGPRANPKPGAKHYVNHLQFSPDGERLMFLHRWRPKGRGGFATRIFTVKADGTDLRLLTDDGGLSHYTWRDSESLLIWANQHGGYAVYDIEDGFQEVLLKLENGHQSYVPGTGNRWLITDTYPGDDRKQSLILYDSETDELFIVARFGVGRGARGQFRADLHPRVSRDGTSVVVDSAHRGGRQQYLIGIDDLLKRGD